MKDFAFEIYIQKTKQADISWKKFISTIFDYDKDFTIAIEFSANDVNLYLYSNKDLSNLTAKILPFILKPIKAVDAAQSTGAKRGSYFFILPNDKNLLEIKEHIEVKGKVTLNKVLWHFKSFMKIKTNTIVFLFEDRNGRPRIAKKYRRGIPFYLIEQIDWSKAVKYKKKTMPIYLKIEEEANLFTPDETDGFLEVEGFPYLNGQNYLPLKNFDFDKHTLIVGQTGVGKSKMISLFVRKVERLRQTDKYAIVVIDPHATLFPDLSAIKGAVNLDFTKSYCDLFTKGADPKVATELTVLLFKTLLKDSFTSRLEQTLKYSIFSLVSTDSMSLGNLRKFLTDMEYRKEILSKLPDGEVMAHFFDTEFIEMQTKFYETAIMPVISLMDELNLLPVFKEGKALKDVINNNFLTVFSLSKMSLGDKATKLLAGLLIQQMFLIAQSGMLKKKLILIIDEVPVIENDAMVTILSEARKFGMSMFLSMQFLDQLSAALLKSILSNVYNYFVFKTNEKDADILAKNLYVNVPPEVIEAAKEREEGKEAIKMRLFTSLNTRECLVRVYANGKYYNCFKARTLDV